MIGGQGKRRARNGFSRRAGSGYGPVMVAASNSWVGMGFGRDASRRAPALRLLLLPFLLLSLALGCLGCGPTAHAAPAAPMVVATTNAVETTSAEAGAPTTPVKRLPSAVCGFACAGHIAAMPAAPAAEVAFDVARPFWVVLAPLPGPARDPFRLKRPPRA